MQEFEAKNRHLAVRGGGVSTPAAASAPPAARGLASPWPAPLLSSRRRLRAHRLDEPGQCSTISRPGRMSSQISASRTGRRHQLLRAERTEVAQLSLTAVQRRRSESFRDRQEANLQHRRLRPSLAPVGRPLRGAPGQRGLSPWCLASPEFGIGDGSCARGITPMGSSNDQSSRDWGPPVSR
jgi:hypothetical protein